MTSSGLIIDAIPNYYIVGWLGQEWYVPASERGTEWISLCPGIEQENNPELLHDHVENLRKIGGAIG